ncbi:nuclear transport factor 2 family protein [Frankia sp. CNm7]|uniref:Nuclear transport factor 2 family protein n=1 Tax=Frankia nepalensis TaxID=1836974 RepID=A0A937RJE5_9ACTN|nr:nuclear transport factor 2 family protein [Frankia nepalensis]MBL7501088.1 nuclear transport factor 2 family protein [Frankia nepalensis]MBL7514725.1 nuclear transport factor 2 family protein [Frankia nepalensis]MBL7524576.1 nuclear transport factor 2 family protein [Frankia nepalensis]MBL7631282.1 nuclear transport factor 2 family protein [Frankia nepalensis]
MSDFPLADELAVRAALARYCHCCDDGDLDGVAALFAPDGLFTFGGRTARGTREILEFFQASSGKEEQRGKHLTVNVVVTPPATPGGTARVASDFVFLRFEEGRLVPALAGRYDDEFVRVDGQWRFASRQARLMRQPRTTQP